MAFPLINYAKLLLPRGTHGVTGWVGLPFLVYSQRQVAPKPPLNPLLGKEGRKKSVRSTNADPSP
ncbi:protein of unknown function [Nitrospina watsonii]|uniref:Uncharacterized protein n=1 Tax=Nitrospina watsonii TaxID=1323948 RepID=A0ABN8W0Z9_9BACT|nr:protein of unknown function [Nitrospina watsonii]